MSNIKNEAGQGFEYMSNIKGEEMRMQNASDQKDCEDNIEYYHEYMRLYIANVVLTNQLKELLAEKNDLLAKLNRLERSQEVSGHGENEDDRKKRSRRSAQEIERHFKCPIENCQKQYGAEGSLNQHIKLKHPELVRDRGMFFKSSEISNQQQEGDASESQIKKDN